MQNLLFFFFYLVGADSKKKKVKFPEHSEGEEPENHEAPVKGITALWEHSALGGRRGDPGPLAGQSPRGGGPWKNLKTDEFLQSKE